MSDARRGAQEWEMSVIEAVGHELVFDLGDLEVDRVNGPQGGPDVAEPGFWEL